jgi:WD repeat-containing protein 1 (actin-interacting protein 1)
MVASGPSAANVCLPDDAPVVATYPPLPSPSRGVRCSLQGNLGRLQSNSPGILYPSQKQVVVRPIDSTTDPTKKPTVYRGHLHSVTACKASPSGAYVGSGDERGSLKIWSLDTIDHLSKYETALLTGPIRDVAWDLESKRLAVGGERSDAAKGADCAKAIAMDGVSAGVLAQMTKGRVSAVAFKPTRPFRVAVAGMDEPKLCYHQGPPFAKIPPTNNVPHETAHSRGGIPALAFASDGSFLVSVGVDRSVCFYDGKSMQLVGRADAVHAATIYDVALDSTNRKVLTASGDGTCQLWEIVVEGDVYSVKPSQTWKVAEHQARGTSADLSKRVPVGGVQLGCTFCGDQPVSVGLNGHIGLLKPDGSVAVWTGHNAPISGLALAGGAGEAPGGGVFYTGDTNGVLCRWDVATTMPTNRLPPPSGNADLLYTTHGTSDRPGAISGLAVLGNNKDTLLSVGWDDNLYVTLQGAVQPEPVKLEAQPRCVAAGKNLAVVGTVKGLWIVNDQGKLTTPQMLATSYEPNAVCVNTADDTVYVGGSDCKVYVYKVAGGTTLQQSMVIEGKHLKPIHSIALSPDGKKLAVGDEKDVCVYDASSDEYPTLISRGRWCFHLQRITCLAWSPDSSILASGGADDSMYLWKVENKATRVHYPYCHRGGFTGLAFVGDREILSAGADSVVHRWDVRKDVESRLS